MNDCEVKVLVYLNEILYVESLKEYVRICLHDRQLITKYQIGELEKLLDKTGFIHVHRSFVVAKSKIRSYTPQAVEIAGKEIPVGHSYRDAIREEVILAS